MSPQVLNLPVNLGGGAFLVHFRAVIHQNFSLGLLELGICKKLS
jgi:hypothetical protein